MILPPGIGLRIVRGSEMEDSVAACLRPGSHVEDPDGIDRRLPSHFYEIPSWEAAMETRLTPHFALWEFVDVDLREAERVRLYPRYVPCAVALLAAHLQLLRESVGRVVRIAANGGYRSPTHALSDRASPHLWGTAANIYRIGEDWMDSRERIDRYAEIARRALPGAWVRSYGESPGHTFDHLHLDLGYFSVEPHGSGAT